MHRRFRRRLDALDPHREGGELLAALAVIRETGQAPPTRAGERDRLNDRLSHVE